MSGGDSLSRMVLLLYAEGIEGGLYVSLNHTRASKYFHTGLRSRSRSRSRSESVVFLGVGVGVDKIYRLRPTPGKLLFLIHRNRHADYLTLLVAGSWLPLLVAGGGGLFRTPLDISGSYRSIFKIQTAFVSPQHDLHF